MYEKHSFCQDRLGTNMGNPEKKGGFLDQEKTYAIVAKVMKDDICTVNSANPW